MPGVAIEYRASQVKSSEARPELTIAKDKEEVKSESAEVEKVSEDLVSGFTGRSAKIRI